MTEPAVFERARALLRHARHCGDSPNQYQLQLNLPEAMELLDWLDGHASPQEYNVPSLRADIERARAEQNPFIVLDGFVIMGIPLQLRTESVQ